MANYLLINFKFLDSVAVLPINSLRTDATIRLVTESNLLLHWLVRYIKHRICTNKTPILSSTKIVEPHYHNKNATS